MLDESLPTFILRNSKDGVVHNNTLYLTQHGSEPQPAYTLRHPDPASVDSKNRYAVALYDSYNPDVLFGEVLVVPGWNQPTLSADEVRKNGGVPPAPQPIMPSEFAIQLYNPDSQINVRHKPSTWKDGEYWEFEMPIQTFRLPSNSTLDRTQNDPSALETTPTIDFKWKKEGKFSKDMMLHFSGKGRNPDGSKKKQKEPDIPIAFFRNMRELTIYESNLQRVDIEDIKGFEVVLLLGAFVIKDIFYGSMSEVFNISEGGRSTLRHNAAGVQSTQKPVEPPRHQRPIPSIPQAVPNTGRPALTVQTPTSPRPPPTDPRSQWEIDSEAARLKKQAEKEEKERKRREKEDAKTARLMAEQEEKAARKRQEAVDKETERLRQEYFAGQRRFGQSGQQQPHLPPRHSTPMAHQPAQPQQTQYRPQQPVQTQYRPAQPSPYLQAPLMSGASASQGYLGPPGPAPGQQPKPKRSSFFGLRSRDDREQKLLKKQSAIF